MNAEWRADQSTVLVTLNGKLVTLHSPANMRLSECLRDELGFTGTKVGCHAGDCGACTVLIDENQACSCLVPVGQVNGCSVTTVEGLASTAIGRALQAAFVELGAAQCGICSPGMLIAAFDLLSKESSPSIVDVQDALGGVLCRCTGYSSIIAAVLRASQAMRADRQTGFDEAELPFSDDTRSAPVGARVLRSDGPAKVKGIEVFGADQMPKNSLGRDGSELGDTLELRVFRSPYSHARFEIDHDALTTFISDHQLFGALTAADIPHNAFAIFADMRDQPVLAEVVVRFKGEAVLALIGKQASLDAIDFSQADHFPVSFDVLPPQLTIHESLAVDATIIQAKYPDNVLCRGRVAKVWPSSGQRHEQHLRSTSFSASMKTQHVEHAYIEPEAGYATWVDQTLTVFACTQTPYMDRDELAHLFALSPMQVRIIPSAVGGGFGGKLDLSVQPLLAAAAIKFKRAVRCVYGRPESMLSSTKRHPSEMNATLQLDPAGNLLSFEFNGDFNTGPYASWGPTVANRVPIHASGPYRIPHILAQTRAVLTHNSVGGAFRGFGVPQSTLINERLIDEAALAQGLDPLEFRHSQAIRAGDLTATGQKLVASVGLQECLAALRPAWRIAQASVAQFNVAASISRSHVRRGVGIASMWYGIGNTVIANPSTMRVGLQPNGRVMLYNGAVDIGQGTYTIMPQICAQALGLPLRLFDQVHADTHLTLDAGKSSASRQTFVSGNAARLAGEALRAKLLAILRPTLSAEIDLNSVDLVAELAKFDLSTLPVDEFGNVAYGVGYFNPPTIALDADGQGVPYATYGFAAQFCELEVDTALGTVKLLAIHAAHDVGKAINPTQVEGQIHGGIAQGIGLALMEDYQAGKTDNLHDYLIPTIGDIPPIVTYLIEDPEPLGPYGAKGVGEPALVATAPAILNAIAHATGIRMNEVPVTPDRLLAALQQ
jgi:aldehyde oxidoreductase